MVQKKCVVGPEDTVGSLKNKVQKLEGEAFIEAIVQPTKNKGVVLVGNSLGSLVALTTALRKPELVAALVASPLPEPILINSSNTSHTKNSRPLQQIKKIIVEIFFKLLPLEIIVPLIARTPLINVGLQAAYHSSIKFDKSLQKIVRTPAQRGKASTALRAMCIGMASRPKAITAPVMLEAFAKSSNRCPFLLIWGEDDKIIPLILGQRLKKEYPWIDFFTLENTGHCPHDESSNKFNKLLINWLGLNLVDKPLKT